MVATAKLSSKNQLVIPSAVRQAVGLKPGDRLAVFVEEGESIRMVKLSADSHDQLRGLLSNLEDASCSWPEIAGG